MLGFRNVHHVGIIVPNMEMSLPFYTDILGFKIYADYVSSGERVSEGVALPGAAIRAVFLIAGQGETFVELLQYLHPSGRYEPGFFQNNDPGIRHITFAVDDIDQVYDQLKEKGVRFFARPQHLEDGNAIAYFYDLDGNILELFQPKKT
jgi:catechol 2,3-dioxygenase-like lactoylglutathione lyase family enzyme